MKNVIDVSYYNNLTDAQWDLLATVIDGVIIRLCFGVTNDSMAAAHVASAKRIGKPFAAYGWVDPTRSVITSTSVFLSAIATHKPASFFCDYEQYWKDWDAYMRGDYAAAYATRFTQAQLGIYYLEFQKEMVAHSPVPIGQYSADWFISEYAPALNGWIYNNAYWEAIYLRYTNPTFLAASKKAWGVPFDIIHIKDLAAVAAFNKGIGRQFESYVEIKGLEYYNWHMDYSVFTDEGFALMFNQQVSLPQPPPVVDPIPVPIGSALYTATTDLNVRNLPTTKGSTIVAWKHTGDTFVVTSLVGLWGKILEGWVYLPNCKIVK